MEHVWLFRGQGWLGSCFVFVLPDNYMLPDTYMLLETCVFPDNCMLPDTYICSLTACSLTPVCSLALWLIRIHVLPDTVCVLVVNIWNIVWEILVESGSSFIIFTLVTRVLTHFSLVIFLISCFSSFICQLAWPQLASPIELHLIPSWGQGYYCI